MKTKRPPQARILTIAFFVVVTVIILVDFTFDWGTLFTYIEMGF